MEELMSWIYLKLSSLGDTFFEDLERDEEGKTVIDNIKIVYNLYNILQLTDNKVRKDIPLSIDIWGIKDQVLEIEDLAEEIDKAISDEVYRNNTLFFIVQKANLWTLSLKDEDKNIRRKQLNYIIRFYKK
ncbi:hypothetical protein KQI86_16705 [Clostridium sp. MSJ-11]|uniref:Uncharacterized protein n=1 Tax=Clostridium mobile TaxID=2841512 RepID=A0ABS6EL63_9CLOT|nr:hypothetical protein [Clostridium mobile]MBU5485963.1 hypothetical protein [Clostridium mobile]